ncbi:hypothetical protein H9P43_003810 [Blastocladiella emersonii ATCC 22665]|nr:hypothetical protein H9P43_003810 [Blastocladiella emersonii ATCC 22665]
MQPMNLRATCCILTFPFPQLSVILGDIVQPFLVYEGVRATPGLPPAVVAAALDTLRKRVIDQVIFFVAVGLGTMVAAYLMQAMWMWAGERQARRVRTKFINAVMAQDLAWFDSHKAGDLTTQLTSDTLMYQEGISEKASQAFAYTIQFISGFAIAFTQSWRLTLVLIATLPAFGISGIVVGKAFAAGASRSQEAYAAAGAVAQEALANIRTVAAFGGQDRAFRKYSKLLAGTVKEGEKKAWISGAGFGVFFGLLYLLFGIGFWYGSTLAVSGEVGGGDVLKCLFAITTGAFSIINLSPSFQAMSKARGAGYRLFEVAESKPTIVDGAVTPAKLDGSVEFRDVRFAYPSRPDVEVLKGISFTAQAGTTVALVGASGSAKSTCIQLMERYYEALSGTIFIDSTPINDLPLKWLRQNVGLVSQEPILFDTTIAENIAYGAPDGLVVTQELLEQVCRDANAHDFISKLPNGYQTMVGERGSLLSGGQKQRIAIARALIGAPRILLLDEATSALDSASEGIVQAALDKASQGRTTIVIAHRLSTIRDADVILVFEKGQIIERGNHNSLLQRGGVYAGLVKAQELKTRKTASTADITTAADAESESDDSDDDGAEEEEEQQAAITAAAASESKKATSKDALASTTTTTKPALDEFEKAEREKAELKKLLKERSVSLWRVVKLQGEEWPFLAVGVLMGSVAGAFLPAFGIILAEVLSVFAIQDKDELTRKALVWTWVFIGLTVGNFFISLFQFGCFGIAGERLTRRIRETAFRAMLRQETGWFDDEKHGTGTLTAQLSEQADRIQNLTGPNAANLIQLVVSMGCGVALAFYYSWQMTLTVLAAVPFLALGSYLEAAVTTGAVGKSRLAYGAAAQRACDAIQNIATVKSLARERDFADGYLENIKAPYRIGVRKALIGSWGFGYSQAVQFLLYAVCFGVGYLFVRDGVITSADLFRVIFVLLFASISFAQAATFTGNAQKAKAAAIAYFDLVDRVPPIDIDSTEGARLVDVAGAVEVAGAEFAYPTRPDAPILRGIDFSQLAGKSLALCGPSGSGKSSVLALLQRLYDVSAGNVKLDGTDVRQWHLQSMREHLAVVSQEPSLFIGTLREAIEYGVPDGKPVTMDMVVAAAKAANIHDFIEGLPEKYETLVTSSQLSGGQKQRVAIARALIRPNLACLLLDEATSALDSASEVIVQDTLDKASQGRTTITIAHRLSTIQRVDLILVVKDGRVVEQGTHFELLDKKGLYAKLVKRQNLGKTV